jgi:hypothetical protein
MPANLNSANRTTSSASPFSVSSVETCAIPATNTPLLSVSYPAYLQVEPRSLARDKTHDHVMQSLRYLPPSRDEVRLETARLVEQTLRAVTSVLMAWLAAEAGGEAVGTVSCLVAKEAGGSAVRYFSIVEAPKTRHLSSSSAKD